MTFSPEQNRIIADLLFPEVQETIEDLEKKYPPRNLPEGAIVTRQAPSPTGFMHLGLLYASLICSRVAAQSKGIFYLRIEDTDQERFVPGAIELIIKYLRHYDIKLDEGPASLEEDIGNYGPYTQSKRSGIYKVCIKHLVLQGLAYPCFMTTTELETLAAEQTQKKLRPGIYGPFAKWRHASADEIIAKLKNGDKYEVIRFRNPGSERNRRNLVDLVKGKLNLPETDNDVVLMKASTGLPVYHLAHVVDDHYMRTTHVIRGDEWLSSMMLHHQLFEVFDWIVPQYAHLGPIDKLDNGNRRKLSKRKDPEANVAMYDQVGYPQIPVLEYLMNIANSSFEDWHKANPEKKYTEFELKLSGLGKSGALLDTQKIENICKSYVARLNATEVYNEALAWAKRQNPELVRLLEDHKEYVTTIFSIERGTAEQRKDIGKWSDVYEEIKYFFDDLFELSTDVISTNLNGLDAETIQQARAKMTAQYNDSDDKDTWLNKLKDIAESLGYAREVKEFKESPEKYKGHFGDIAKIYRVFLTGRNRSPDLYWVMKVMGSKRIMNRLGESTKG